MTSMLPASPSASGSPASSDAQMIAQLLQQQQQLMQALGSQQQSVVTALQQLAPQQQQPSQAMLAAQMLSLSTLGQLKSFDGNAGPNGLALREWLAHAELYFAARESAMGVTAQQGDASRVYAMRAALTDDALRWFSSLPSPQPGTFAEFKVAMEKRFDSVSSSQVREAILQRFVDGAKKIRDKLNVEGINRYTTLFMQHATQIPAARMTDASKRMLYAQGLPARYSEMVLVEDAKANPAPLHELAQTILAKATMKAHANSGGYPHGISASAAAASSSQPDAMEIDAISLCAASFGISTAEATRYMEPQEGWAVHDTHRGSGPRASAAAAASTSSEEHSQTHSEDPQMERLLAAFESRFGKSLSGSGKSQSQRRNVPNDLSKEVPQELANARKEAGLCIKCGITKYEPGGKGHNSRTCKLPVNKSLSASEGRRKANF